MGTCRLCGVSIAVLRHSTWSSLDCSVGPTHGRRASLSGCQKGDYSDSIFDSSSPLLICFMCSSYDSCYSCICV
ncbi:hypothetical protein V8C43DRAFT_266878 [Trichoderma afarasin]